ncbi:MAG: hypothetical protein JWR18_961 [Segetibacter sp.]|nr:hypothetical protein [Segetibacter sp.]
MSHFKERKEKNCLNCNAQVQGRYCQVCGQENVEPKETFGHLVTHLIYDITHLDGKFFSSLKYLLFKPGFFCFYVPSYGHKHNGKNQLPRMVRVSYVPCSTLYDLVSI